MFTEMKIKEFQGLKNEKLSDEELEERSLKIKRDIVAASFVKQMEYLIALFHSKGVSDEVKQMAEESWFDLLKEYKWVRASMDFEDTLKLIDDAIMATPTGNEFSGAVRPLEVAAGKGATLFTGKIIGVVLRVEAGSKAVEAEASKIILKVESLEKVMASAERIKNVHIKCNIYLQNAICVVKLS